MFEKILLDKYSVVHIRKYASERRLKLGQFIRLINRDDEYIFVVDMDNAKNDVERKNCVTENIADNVEHKKIVIIKKEIESWYQAGLNQKDSASLGIEYVSDTELVTKGMLYNTMPSKFITKDDFLIEIMKNFSVDEAKKHNKSFHSCYDKIMEDVRNPNDV